MPDFSWYEMPGNPVNEHNDSNSQSQKVVGTLDVDTPAYELGSIICEFTDVETAGRGVVRRFFIKRPGSVGFEPLCEWFPDEQQTGPYGGKMTTVSFVVCNGVIHAVAEVLIGEPPTAYRLYYGQYDLNESEPEWTNVLIDEHEDGHASPDIAVNPNGATDLRLVILYMKHVSAARWDLKKTISTNGIFWWEVSSAWIDTTQMPSDILGTKPQVVFGDDSHIIVHFNGAFNGLEDSATLCHSIWDGPLTEETRIGEVEIYTPQMAPVRWGPDYYGVGMLGYRANENPKFACWYPISGISDIETVDDSAFPTQWHTKQYALTARLSDFHAFFYSDSIGGVIHRIRQIYPLQTEWRDGDPLFCSEEPGYPGDVVLNCLNAERSLGAVNGIVDDSFAVAAVQTNNGPNYNLFCRCLPDNVGGGPGGGAGVGCYLGKITILDASCFDLSLKTGAISKRDSTNPIMVMDWTTLSDDTIIFVNGTQFRKFDYSTPSYWPLEWRTFKFPDSTWQNLKWIRVTGDFEEDFQIVAFNDETSPASKIIPISASDSGKIKYVNLNGRRFYLSISDISNSNNIIDEIEINVIQTQPSR